MSTICLLLISDGRDPELQRTLASAKEMLPKLDQLVHIDDRAHRLGFAGAIQAGWEQVQTDYVFHLEQDFVLNQPVPVHRMLGVLERHEHLAQLVLKRQAWNAEERAAGGIVELHPDDFAQRTDRGDIWTEHRRFWSTNPSLYAAGFCAQGWPQVEHSEGIFTHRLLADPDLRFAFWGAKHDPPLVTHIGDTRAGRGY